MRTTIEIPDGLFRRTKRAALEQGETIKEIVIRALRREVDENHATPLRRVEFPLIRTDRPGSVKVTNAEIEALEIDDDVGR